MNRKTGAAIIAVFLAIGSAFYVSASDVAELHLNAAEKKQINSDTVGWLQVPGTEIDQVIVQYKGDNNQYYLRKNFLKEPDFMGSCFADYRCVFDNGGLSRNTVIYGASMPWQSDGMLFSQLDYFRQKEFVDQNPYIYFATTDKTMIWQVFAVSIMDISVPYNIPDLDDAQFGAALEQVRANSMYDFNGITVGAEDKILTLSTSDYTVTNTFPSTNRFVIMAKLVDSEAETPEIVSTPNNPNTGR